MKKKLQSTFERFSSILLFSVECEVRKTIRSEKNERYAWVSSIKVVGSSDNPFLIYCREAVHERTEKKRPMDFGLDI
jgi:hypothetical protein